MLNALRGFGAGGGIGGAYGGAGNTINQYTQRGIGLLNPYMEGGKRGIAGAEGFLNQFGNPEEMYNNFAKNYQMSAGAQNKLHTGMNAVRNAMASKGLTGSGAEGKALTGYSQGVINEDMNQQFNNVLNAGHLGLSAANTLYGGGLSASMRGAGLYGQAGEDIGGLQEAEEQQREREQQQHSQNMWGAAGLAGGLASEFL